MSEAYNGMYLVEGTIDKIKDIVSKKQHSKIDGVTVDLFTASAISQIYDKVNDANKKKMEKLPITKLAALAMKMMKNEYVPEELDLDESGHTDVASAMNNVKVATSALTKMSGELSKLSPEDALPSWWTNKVAVAVDKLDGMADYLDTQVEETDLDEAISGDQYYYVDPKGVVAAVGNKDAMRKMNMKQAKDGNKGGSFSQNLKKYKVGDKIKEEVELDEFTISDLKGMGVKPTPDQMKELQKISSKSGGNITRTDLKKVGIKEEVDLDEASARSDAKRSMSRDRDLSRKGSSLDKDDFATDDDVKAASKNIMMQLRKAANLRGTFAVEFGDKKKVKVDPKVAQAAASKYNSLRRPAD